MNKHRFRSQLPMRFGRVKPGRLFFLALVVWAASFLGIAPVRGQEKSGEEPLFPHAGANQTTPAGVAAGVVAGSSLGGPWHTLALLHGGDAPEVSAWTLWKPFLVKNGRIQLGAGTLFLGGFAGAGGVSQGVHSLTELATLKAGDYLECWALRDTDRLRRIPPILISAIEDGQPIVAGTVEADAYARILTLAHYTSSAAFRKAARTDLTYAHLFNEPEKYRGQVVRIQGQLHRILRFDPPPEAASEGVHDLYEAWIRADAYGAYPVCVVFTELPDGFPRRLLNQARLEEAIEVEFNGYFYKRFRYEGGRRIQRETPLLIGHGLMVKSITPAFSGESAPWPSFLLFSVLGVIGTISLVVVGLTYWYRRNDDRIRMRILASRGDFVLPEPDAEPYPRPEEFRESARLAQRRPLSPVNRISWSRTQNRQGESPGSWGTHDPTGENKGPPAAEGDPGARPRP